MRASADIDVLVHPDDFDGFVAAMASAGWREAVPYTGAPLARPHSVDLLNDYWPVSVDAHFRFPGFLENDVVVFETLWARRVRVMLAGQAVETCDRASHVAVVGLHLLRRNPDGESPAIDDLVERAREQLGTSGLVELGRVAEETACTVSLRPVLSRLGVIPETSSKVDPAAVREWLEGVHAVAGMGWGWRLRQAPLRQWPRVIWRAVLLTNAEIDAHHGGDGTTLGRTRARLRRLSRLTRLAPGIVRGLRSRGVNRGGPR